MSTRTKSCSTFLRDPDLPFLEVRDSRIAGRPFGPHTHPVYTLAATLRGTTTLVWRGGRRTAPPGSLVLVPPGVVHACNPRPGQAFEYLLFALAPDWFEERLQAAWTAVQAASTGLSQAQRADALRRPAVVRDPQAAQAFSRLGRGLMTGQIDAGEKRDLLEAALSALLPGLARGLLAGVAAGPEHRAAGLAARYLARRPEAHVSLEELARTCGLTPCHLTRVFRRAYAMTPHAYQNQLRVELAKTLLTQGASIAQVAQQAGFSDQSHLNRVFRRYAAATPRQYQAGGA